MYVSPAYIYIYVCINFTYSFQGALLVTDFANQVRLLSEGVFDLMSSVSFSQSHISTSRASPPVQSVNVP